MAGSPQLGALLGKAEALIGAEPKYKFSGPTKRLEEYCDRVRMLRIAIEKCGMSRMQMLCALNIASRRITLLTQEMLDQEYPVPKE